MKIKLFALLMAIALFVGSASAIYTFPSGFLNKGPSYAYGTSNLNYTTVTDLRASDDVYAVHLMAALANLNATTMTNGYASGTWNVAGVSTQNATRMTTQVVSGNSYQNQTYSSGIVNSGTANLNLTKSTIQIISGNSYQNQTYATGVVNSGTSNLNRTKTTDLESAGTSYLNRTKATQFEAADRSDLNRTRITQLDVSALSALNRTQITQVEVSGDTYLNDTYIGSGDTLAVNDADGLTVGGKIIPQALEFTYPLSSTSANGTIFSPVAGDIQILGIVETHSVASTAAEATSTLTIVKCTGTETPASTGASVMTNTFDLKGTPETMQSATLNPDIGPTMLNTTERLGYRFNNPITSLAGGSVTVAYTRI